MTPSFARAYVRVLVDRGTLRRHDMRVPTGSHFVIELRIVAWWSSTASHGVKRDLRHSAGVLVEGE